MTRLLDMDEISTKLKLPSGRAMQSMLNRQKSQTSLEELQNGHQIHAQSSHFDPTQSSHDDFLEQMLSALPSGAWPPELSNDLTDDDRGPSDPEIARSHQFQQSDDLPSPLSSKPRQHLIGGGADSPTSAVNALMLQQQLLFSRGLLPMPLSLGGSESFDFLQDDAVNDSAFKSLNPGDENSVQALYNGFAGSLKATGQTLPHFLNPQNFGAPTTATNQTSAGGSVGGSPAQPRQRARARRGQATDPHSIAERLRRERIAERMKSLQELVPNANKTDKASMLDEIIDYVKFLQLQVKVLSMSRLGGGGAVGPFAAAAAAADISSEASGGVRGRSSNGTQTASAMNDGMSVAEHQVAKLMEEDMGSAMQYLQGKGLCLMPISLATAISTATCHSRNPPTTSTNPLLVSGADSDCGVGGGGGPPSPSVSALTAQSATTRNGGIEDHVKDAASVSNP